MTLLAEAAPLGSPATHVSLAIGVFDGVHRGHQEVLRHTLAAARAAGGLAIAATFDRHPSAVVAPDRTPPLILPLWRKLEAIEAAGVHSVLLLKFDHAFSRQPPEVFIQNLVRGFGRVVQISVGSTFVFGHRRSGNVALLRQLGADLGFAVEAVDPVIIDDDVVSSSRIRELIQQGHFGSASRLLGREYTLAGEIVAGDQLGRRLGFPTANLAVDGLALPPGGVYAADVFVAGQRWPAAVNVGVRPTLDESSAGWRVEAHLLDFTGELYGSRVEVAFRRRIRPEQKFASIDALAAQIRSDIQTVRNLTSLSHSEAPESRDPPSSEPVPSPTSGSA